MAERITVPDDTAPDDTAPEVETNETLSSEMGVRDWRRPLFAVEQVGDTLIIVPMIRGGMFRYAQLQTEANALRRHLDQTPVGGLILDLKRLDYLGAEVIGAVVALARKVEDVGGRAVFCMRLPNSAKCSRKWACTGCGNFFPREKRP